MKKTVTINDCEENPVMDFLRNIRRSQNITQEQIAKKMGTHKSNISRFEKNVNSSTLKTIKSYISALDGVELQIVFKSIMDNEMEKLEMGSSKEINVRLSLSQIKHIADILESRIESEWEEYSKNDIEDERFLIDKLNKACKDDV